MENYTVYVPRLVKRKDNFAPGHRACIGCGEALAVRLAFKALGNNVIVSNATGCMEIVASQLPSSTWHLPWIHTLFENAAAVASGIEAGYKAMRRKGLAVPENTKVVAIVERRPVLVRYPLYCMLVFGLLLFGVFKEEPFLYFQF